MKYNSLIPEHTRTTIAGMAIISPADTVSNTLGKTCPDSTHKTPVWEKIASSMTP